MLAFYALMIARAALAIPNPMAFWNTNQYCGTMSYEFNLYGRNEHTPATTIDLEVLSVVQGQINFRFRCQEVQSRRIYPRTFTYSCKEQSERETPYFIMWPRAYRGVGYCFWQYREEPPEFRLPDEVTGESTYERRIQLRNPDQRGQFSGDFVRPAGWRYNHARVEDEEARGQRGVPQEGMQRMTLIVGLLPVTNAVHQSSGGQL